MRIEFRDIELQNYRSHKQTQIPVKSGRHLIVGSNGSGKSSILESIPWTLTDHNLRSRKVSMNDGGDCMTSCDFVIDDVAYKVVKYNGHGEHNNSVKVFRDGEDLSVIRIKDNKNIREDIIKLPVDVLLSSFFILQGMPSAFGDLGGTNRKLILEDMLGFDDWKQYSDILKEMMKRLKEDSEPVITTFDEFKEEMIKINSELDTKIKLSQEDQNINEEIKSKLRDEMKVLKTNALKLDEKMNELNINSIRKDINVLKTRCDNITREVSDYKKISEEKVCPTCEQHYPKSKIEEVNNKINVLSSELKEDSSSLSNLENKVDHYEDLRADRQDIDKKITEYAIKYEGVLNVRDYSNDISDLKDKLDLFNKKVNRLKVQKDNLDKRMEKMKIMYECLLPSSKFRTELLKKYVIQVNDFLELISSLIFVNKVISLQVSDNNKSLDVNIIDDNKEVLSYKDCSGGEKRRINIACVLALQKFMYENSGVKSNLLIFDEILDSIDDEGISPIINAIKEIFPEDICVWFITHRKDINHMFSSVIKVEKSIHGITEVNLDKYNEQGGG